MTAFKPGKLFVFGRVYGQPGKIDKEMRSTPMCTYCKMLFITLFKIYSFILKFIARSMIVSTDSAVFKLLELYGRDNNTCQETC